MYDASAKRCTLPPTKVKLYICRINAILSAGATSSKDFEKLIGNLVWASYVEPWGRPFLSAIGTHISRDRPSEYHRLTPYTRMALVIWKHILRAGEGVSYRWILGALPTSQDAWFVDASTSWGIGGCAGNHYFMVPNKELIPLFALYHSVSDSHLMQIPRRRLPIAYIELIAVLVGFSVFAKHHQNERIILYSDNTDVVGWLQKSRCSAGIGFKLLAAIEYFKRTYFLKISARHIPGRHNNSADSLSRGSVPRWLNRGGCRRQTDLSFLSQLIEDPLNFWQKLTEL